MENSTKYVVLKLITTVTVLADTPQEHTVEIGGVSGVLPVYDTEDEAKAASLDGKYQVLAVKAFTP